MKCSVSGCRKPMRAKTFCSTHYAIWSRNGSPTVYRKRHDGTGGLTKDGYLLITIHGRKILEHRYVMQQILGRPLEQNEIVHHINGDRLNNHPTNLILMSLAAHTKQHKRTLFSSDSHKQCNSCLQIKPRRYFSPERTLGRALRDPHKGRCKLCLAKARRLERLLSP